jgi:hypothetical protein
VSALSLESYKSQYRPMAASRLKESDHCDFYLAVSLELALPVVSHESKYRPMAASRLKASDHRDFYLAISLMLALPILKHKTNGSVQTAGI